MGFFGTSSYFDIIFVILGFLFWPIVIVGAILFWFARSRQKRLSFLPHPHLKKEDIVGQLFYVLGYFFLANLLIGINRELGHPVSIWWLSLTTIILAFVGAYKLKSVYLLPFALIGSMSWWGSKAGDWIAKSVEIGAPSTLNNGIAALTLPASVRPLSLLIGLCLMAIFFYIAGSIHHSQRRYERFGFVYTMIGLLFVTLVLFILSTQVGLEAFGYMSNGLLPWQSLPFALSLLFFGLMIILSLTYALQHQMLNQYEALAVVGFTLLFLLLSIIPKAMLPTPDTLWSPMQDALYPTDSGAQVRMFWSLVWNIAVFVQVIGIIFIGYIHRQIHMINLGTLLLFLLIAIKYFDWFFTFLDKSIFFITAGIFLFIIGAVMEKGRRRVLSALQEGANV